MNIVMLGQSGFPYGMATIQKMKLIAEGLAEHSNQITILNRLPVHPPKEPYLSLKPIGCINGVNYIYTSGTHIRPDHFIKRNILRFISYFQELNYLAKIHRKRNIDVVIIYETYIIDLIYYYLLSKIFRYKIYLHYVELRSKISGKGFFESINNKLFDRFAFNFLHGNLPISHFLEDYAEQRRSGIPQFRLPTLVNFSLFDSVEKKDGRYFLFCGSADYFEIYNLIINAFEEANLDGIELLLVAGGSSDGMAKVKQLVINSQKKNEIRLVSGIDYDELIYHYCNATALLIPLREIAQDQARFPHKIGEYTAARKTIITNSVGEINYFFSHRESAYFAEGFDKNSLVKALTEICNQPKIAVSIGNKAYEIGRKAFDHVKVTKNLNDFFLQRNKL